MTDKQENQTETIPGTLPVGTAESFTGNPDLDRRLDVLFGKWAFISVVNGDDSLLTPTEYEVGFQYNYPGSSVGIPVHLICGSGDTLEKAISQAEINCFIGIKYRYFKEMMELEKAKPLTVQAPWTPEQVRIINEYQQLDMNLAYADPYVCRKPFCESANSNILVATESGLKCPVCKSYQLYEVLANLFTIMDRKKDPSNRAILDFTGMLADETAKAAEAVWNGSQDEEYLKAPWTPEQVDVLNEYQETDLGHPYTCGSKNRTQHPDQQGVLVATIFGWICPYCDYKQDWAGKFLFELVKANRKKLTDRGDFEDEVQSHSEKAVWMMLVKSHEETISLLKQKLSSHLGFLKESKHRLEEERLEYNAAVDNIRKMAVNISVLFTEAGAPEEGKQLTDALEFAKKSDGRDSATKELIQRLEVLITQENRREQLDNFGMISGRLSSKGFNINFGTGEITPNDKETFPIILECSVCKGKIVVGIDIPGVHFLEHKGKFYCDKESCAEAYKAISGEHENDKIEKKNP